MQERMLTERKPTDEMTQNCFVACRANWLGIIFGYYSQNYNNASHLGNRNPRDTQVTRKIGGA